jgi:hypothetical protein
MPSFDNVNYAIRPNKTIERRIVFSSLVELSKATGIDLETFRFVGLGSLWFIDFLMAHRQLGISSMISLEQSELGYKRAKFNCPLSCVTIKHGETTALIPELDFQSHKSIVWLDYDTSIDGPVLKDIEMLGSICAPDSIVIVTINAKKNQLPSHDADNNEISHVESLRNIAGDSAPASLENKDFQPKNYPSLLCTIIENKINGAVLRSGRKETFKKLFNLVYKDGTPMVTFGGVLASPEVTSSIDGVITSGKWEGISNKTIEIPPLTLKEKMAIDRALPSNTNITEDQIKGMGFQLRQAQIDSYQRYYLHYPMFGEFLI